MHNHNGEARREKTVAVSAPTVRVLQLLCLFVGVALLPGEIHASTTQADFEPFVLWSRNLTTPYLRQQSPALSFDQQFVYVSSTTREVNPNDGYPNITIVGLHSETGATAVVIATGIHAAGNVFWSGLSVGQSHLYMSTLGHHPGSVVNRKCTTYAFSRLVNASEAVWKHENDCWMNPTFTAPVEIVEPNGEISVVACVGSLIKFNATTGDVIWKAMQGSCGAAEVSKPPAGSIGPTSRTLIISTAPDAPGLPLVYAIDAATGASVWTSGPLFANGTQGYSLEVWTQNRDEGHQAGANRAEIYALDGVFPLRVVRLNAVDGSRMWTDKAFVDTFGVEGNPLVHDGVMMLPGIGALLGVRTATGALLWNYSTTGPFAIGVAASAGTAYVTEYSNCVGVVSVGTGSPKGSPFCVPAFYGALGPPSINRKGTLLFVEAMVQDATERVLLMAIRLNKPTTPQ